MNRVYSAERVFHNDWFDRIHDVCVLLCARPVACQVITPSKLLRQSTTTEMPLHKAMSVAEIVRKPLVHVMDRVIGKKGGR